MRNYTSVFNLTNWFICSNVTSDFSHFKILCQEKKMELKTCTCDSDLKLIALLQACHLLYSHCDKLECMEFGLLILLHGFRLILGKMYTIIRNFSVKLTQKVVPGAELLLYKKVEKNTICQLKRWLKCRKQSIKRKIK